MENKEIIDVLNFCAAQCDRCHHACNIEKEKGMLNNCIQMDQDCADICRLTAQIVERNSDNAELFLKLCSEICTKCAIECEKHEHMEHCKKCGEACRKCAEVCSAHQLQGKT